VAGRLLEFGPRKTEQSERGKLQVLLQREVSFQAGPPAADQQTQPRVVSADPTAGPRRLQQHTVPPLQLHSRTRIQIRRVARKPDVQGLEL